MMVWVVYQMELLEYSVDEKRKRLVIKIAASNRKAMSQMRDVVWTINSQNDTCADLMDRLQEFALDRTKPLDIHCAFQVGEG